MNVVIHCLPFCCINYVRHKTATNLLEHPKVGWITEHMHEHIKLSHCQCTLMYTCMWAESPFTGVYSSHKARQIDFEGCPLLSVDLDRYEYDDPLKASVRGAI